MQLSFDRLKILLRGTRAEMNIIPTVIRAGKLIIPTRASYEINPSALYLSLKKKKEGRHENNRL